MAQDKKPPEPPRKRWKLVMKSDVGYEIRAQLGDEQVRRIQEVIDDRQLPLLPGT